MNTAEKIYYEGFLAPGQKAAHPYHEEASLDMEEGGRSSDGQFTLPGARARRFEELSDQEVKDACFALQELPLEEQIPYMLNKTGLDGLFGERERTISGRLYRYGLPLATPPYSHSEGDLHVPAKLGTALGLATKEGSSEQGHEPAITYEYWGGAGAEVNRFFFRQYRKYHYRELVSEYEAQLDVCDTVEREQVLIEEWMKSMEERAAALRRHSPQLNYSCYELQQELLLFASNQVHWQGVYECGMLAALCRMQQEYLPASKRKVELAAREQDRLAADTIEASNTYARAHYLYYSSVYSMLCGQVSSKSTIARLMAPLVGCSANTLRKYLMALDKGFDAGKDDPLYYPHNLLAAIELLKAAGEDSSKVEAALVSSKGKYGGTKKGR